MDVCDPTHIERKLAYFTSLSVEGSKVEILGLIAVHGKSDAAR